MSHLNDLIQRFIQDVQLRDRITELHVAALRSLLKAHGPVRVCEEDAANNEPIFMCVDDAHTYITLSLDPCEHQNPSESEKKVHGH
jgi:hypothetical protein